MPTLHRLRYAGAAAVLTLGLTALAAVTPGPEFLVPAVAVTGWFLVTPLVAIFGVPDREGDPEDADPDPLATLQDRYAAGEISEAEFERRVERILETDAALGEDATVERTDRELELELERE